MNIKPIRNDEDLALTFKRLEAIFQADEMEVLVALVEAYENKHYPINSADPIDAIKFRMNNKALRHEILRLILAPVVEYLRC